MASSLSCVAVFFEIWDYLSWLAILVVPEIGLTLIFLLMKSSVAKSMKASSGSSGFSSYFSLILVNSGTVIFSILSKTLTRSSS